MKAGLRGRVTVRAAGARAGARARVEPRFACSRVVFSSPSLSLSCSSKRWGVSGQWSVVSGRWW